MPAMVLPIRTIVLNTGTVTTGYNARTSAGSPVEPVNCYITINSTVTSNSTSTPAFDTGTGWKAGSLIHVTNNSTVTGATEIGRAHV